MKEDRDEQKEFETGPLSVLMQSVKNNTQVGPIDLLLVFGFPHIPVCLPLMWCD